MITRIIKLHLKPEYVEEFKTYASQVVTDVKAIQGCNMVDILVDKNDHSVWFIYAIWESEYHLNRYRRSKINIEMVRKVKPWLEKEIQAWTVEDINS